MSGDRHLPADARLVVVLVGLPARGKTYLARKLARYLTWLGFRARTWNVGNYRRDRFGAHVPATFFDPRNEDGLAARRAVAERALDDLLGWLGAEGHVGIYDATNTTRERRAWVRLCCEQRGFRVLFVESICDRDDIVEANIRETKLSAPDYVGIDPEAAVADFRARIDHYARAYQPMGDDERSWIRIVNVGDRAEINHVRGYLPGRIVHFALNLHITKRAIWLSRHGESEYNERGLLGGDAPLTERGRAYARALSDLLRERESADASIWCSSLQRAIETASSLGRPWTPLKALDEIDAGVCDGMSYADIARELPGEWEARQADKLRYRYPRGESYEDVIGRLEPVIIELERQRRPLVLVAHQAVLRALYAYLVDLPREDVPNLSIPLHTAIRLLPHAYGCQEERFPL